MSATSKSTRRVLKTAYAMAQGALPACSHRFSPKKFTQHQLLDQTLVAAAEVKILKKRLRLTAIDAMLDAAARRRMARYFERPPQARRYGQRWQVETVFSMIERRLGETVSARGYHRQNRACC